MELFPVFTQTQIESHYTGIKERLTELTNFNNAYETAHARKWLAEDEAGSGQAVSDMVQARLAQIKIFRDPDFSNSLKILLGNPDDLSPAQAANLRVANSWRSLLAPFMADTEEQSADRIRAYETPLGHAEQTWLASLDHEDRTHQWAAQKDSVFNAFKAFSDTYKGTAQAENRTLYDFALSRFVPGMDTAAVDKLFEDLKTGYDQTYQNVKHAIEDRGDEGIKPLPSLSTNIQSEIFTELRKAMLDAAGWDEDILKEKGIEISQCTAATGFCWGNEKKMTIAIETYEDNPMKSLANAMHEFGHMLYLLEMNRLKDDLKGKPAGTFNGFGAHEFSAMYFEMAAYREEFFKHATPVIHNVLNRYGIDSSAPEWSADNLYKLSISPALEDTEWCASEIVLTPNMAWRMEAERDILAAFDRGDEDAARAIIEDLPNRQANTMEEYLGVRHDPANFSIQESHWFEGLIGYFPAYIVGAQAAAQMHRKLTFEERLPDGEAQSLKEYLNAFYKPMQEGLFLKASVPEAEKAIRDAVGPRSTSVYMDRLGAPASPKGPGPDRLLKNQKREASIRRNQSLQPKQA